MNKEKPWIVEYETYTSKGIVRRRFRTEGKARAFYKKRVSAVISASVYQEFEKAAVMLRLQLHRISETAPGIRKAWASLNQKERDKLFLAQQKEIEKLLEGLF